MGKIEKKVVHSKGGVTGKGFMPGKSGNPGGRAAMPEACKALVRETTPELILELIKIARTGKKDSDKIHAIEVMFDRVYGRPVQALDIDGKMKALAVDTSALSAKQQMELASALCNIKQDYEPEPHV